MDKSWRVILAFIGIFVAGTVTGGFGSTGLLVRIRILVRIENAERTAGCPVVP